MSLINDALKRARQIHSAPADIPAAPTLDATPPPLHPVENAEPAPNSLRPLILILPALLLAGLGGAMLWNGWATPKTIVQSRSATTANAPRPTPAPEADKMPRTSASESPEANAGVPPALNPLARASNVIARAATEKNATLDAIHGEPDRPAAPVPARSASPATDVTPTPAKSEPVAAPAAVSPAKPVATVFQTSRDDVPAGPIPPFKLQGIFFRVKNPTVLIDGRVLSLQDEIEGWRVVAIDRHGVKMGRGTRTHLLTLR